jgi:hypothetical protein
MNHFIGKIAYKVDIAYFNVTYFCIQPGAHPKVFTGGGGGAETIHVSF